MGCGASSSTAPAPGELRYLEGDYSNPAPITKPSERKTPLQRLFPALFHRNEFKEQIAQRFPHLTSTDVRDGLLEACTHEAGRQERLVAVLVEPCVVPRDVALAMQAPGRAWLPHGAVSCTPWVDGVDCRCIRQHDVITASHRAGHAMALLCGGEHIGFDTQLGSSQVGSSPGTPPPAGSSAFAESPKHGTAFAKVRGLPLSPSGSETPAGHSTPASHGTPAVLSGSDFGHPESLVPILDGSGTAALHSPPSPTASTSSLRRATMTTFRLPPLQRAAGYDTGFALSDAWSSPAPSAAFAHGVLSMSHSGDRHRPPKSRAPPQSPTASTGRSGKGRGPRRGSTSPPLHSSTTSPVVAATDRRDRRPSELQSSMSIGREGKVSLVAGPVLTTENSVDDVQDVAVVRTMAAPPAMAREGTSELPMERELTAPPVIAVTGVTPMTPDVVNDVMVLVSPPIAA